MNSTFEKKKKKKKKLKKHVDGHTSRIIVVCFILRGSWSPHGGQHVEILRCFHIVGITVITRLRLVKSSHELVVLNYNYNLLTEFSEGWVNRLNILYEMLSMNLNCIDSPSSHNSD